MIDNVVNFRVLLFASLRETMGADEVEIAVNAAAPTVADLLAACATQHPPLAPWLPYVKVAVNCVYADPGCNIATEDEIALLPPVAGG